MNCDSEDSEFTLDLTFEKGDFSSSATSTAGIVRHDLPLLFALAGFSNFYYSIDQRTEIMCWFQGDIMPIFFYVMPVFVRFCRR